MSTSCQTYQTNKHTHTHTQTCINKQADTRTETHETWTCVGMSLNGQLINFWGRQLFRWLILCDGNITIRHVTVSCATLMWHLPPLALSSTTHIHIHTHTHTHTYRHTDTHTYKCLSAYITSTICLRKTETVSRSGNLQFIKTTINNRSISNRNVVLLDFPPLKIELNFRVQRVNLVKLTTKTCFIDLASSCYIHHSERAYEQINTTKMILMLQSETSYRKKVHCPWKQVF